MRSALAIGGALLVLALGGCGGDNDGDSEGTQAEPAPVITATGAEVNIVADCGPDPVVGTDESSVTAEGVTCQRALDVAIALPEAGCDFSVEPECDVAGYTCIRASEEDADEVVFECTKGDALVTIRAPHVE